MTDEVVDMETMNELVEAYKAVNDKQREYIQELKELILSHEEVIEILKQSDAEMKDYIRLLQKALETTGADLKQVGILETGKQGYIA